MQEIRLRPLFSVLWLTVAFGCGSADPIADPDRDLAFEAAWNDDAATMRELLARNPSLSNAQEPETGRRLTERLFDWFMDFEPTRVLHVAARQGHADIVKLLLDAGADVNPPDRLAATPLHLATQYGHEKVVKLLVSAGANVEARRNGDMTPLHLGSSHGRFSTVKLLLEGGAKVHARAANGWTPLHFAASNGHVNVARLLLSQGAALEAATDDGSTPLHFAVSAGHADVAELLLSRGADVDAAAKDGRTALDRVFADDQLTAMLLRYGARKKRK
jgi:ankyrin repeat protein